MESFDQPVRWMGDTNLFRLCVFNTSRLAQMKVFQQRFLLFSHSLSRLGVVQKEKELGAEDGGGLWE